MPNMLYSQCNNMFGIWQSLVKVSAIADETCKIDFKIVQQILSHWTVKHCYSYCIVWWLKMQTIKIYVLIYQLIVTD
jgi:hypothetical protein